MRTFNDGSRYQTSRRRLLQLAAGGGGIALLGAGGGHAIAQDDKISIDFWTAGGSGTFCGGFNTIGQNYEALHPNVDIGETQCGTGTQAFNEVLLARIAAGNPPDATLLWSPPVGLAVRGALEPLDELMASSAHSQVENWPEAVLASCQFNGQTFGLPATAGSYAIAYNQEMFEAKGVPSDRASFPKTWDEWRAISKEFTVWNGDTLETAGFVPTFGAVEFAIMSALNGGQIYDAANQVYTIDSETNIEMMDYMLAWFEEEYKGDIEMVRRSGPWTDYVVEGKPPGFQDGRLGMIQTGFWIAGEFYAQTEPKYERWDAASYPVGPSGTTTVSGYWPNWLAIPSGSENVQEVFSYLDYICFEGMPVWFNNIPDLPANKQVPRLVPSITTERRGEEFANNITDFFRAQLDVATPMWNSPAQDFSNDQINRATEQVWYKQATPKEALAEAQRASQAELERVLASIS